jgi:hypothetical protein
MTHDNQHRTRSARSFSWALPSLLVRDPGRSGRGLGGSTYEVNARSPIGGRPDQVFVSVPVGRVEKIALDPNMPPLFA